MMKSTIQVDTSCGQKAVAALTVVPGLAIHKALGGYPSWSITHIPTGRWLALAYTRAEARRIALAIKDLADWPAITVDTVPPGLSSKVREIAQSICPPRRRM